MIKLIACVDESMGLGKDNKLLTHIPKDLKHFKETTEGKICVFGRKTYESLPKRPLPNRKTYVMTRDNNIRFEGCTRANSFNQILRLSETEDVYICGGDSIYKMFLPLADELIISHMEESFDADAFFPEIDENIWTPYSCEGVEDKVNFSIIKYKRR